MRIYHNTRNTKYRKPFGAAPVGSTVFLGLEVWETSGADCTCRLWVDGKGESFVPMEKVFAEDKWHFSCEIKPEEPALVWYSFIVNSYDSGCLRYGAREGSTGGEGVIYDHEPPSFQITAYKPRKLPEWYRRGIVYQIFPDRFFKGKDWDAIVMQAEKDARLGDSKRRGPVRAACDDWNKTPFYLKDEAGRVVQWDFYGGTLAGIEEKLDYLKDMGITVLYLNPIFEAASNHRYDTGNYMKVEELLGGDKAFEALALAAEKRGISIILDGVFNHTGCDSMYFNKYGNYDTVGAYQGENSPYRGWYCFDNSPVGYECWWGVDDLPNVNEGNQDLQKYIYGGPDSVVRHWLKKGAKGWRLDVADELPDEFIQGIKKATVESLGDEGLVIGEVWEDASNKISYGKLRRYFLGDELDGAMNYPLTDSLQAFLLGRISGGVLSETLTSLHENYPRDAFYGSLNLMGSHDRMRIMTIMGEAPSPDTMSPEQKRDFRLEEGKRGMAKGRIWLLTLVQMTMPGVPCIYYGDEAGLEGYADPYNRGSFPWGGEDRDMQTIYRNALALRKMFPVLTDGDFEVLDLGDDLFGFVRRGKEDSMSIVINRSQSQTYKVEIPTVAGKARELISGQELKYSEDGRRLELTLYPLGSAAVYFTENKGYGKEMQRGAGVLCHITSLPSSHKGAETGACGKRKFGDIGDEVRKFEGVGEEVRKFGDIGDEAKKFVDLLAEAGQKYWQILPLNPADEHGSPYAGTSAFAANTMLLPESEEELREEFKTFVPDADGQYQKFLDANREWLLPFALFAALKEKFENKSWQEWPAEYRKFSAEMPEAIKKKEPEIFEEMQYQAFCQYKFDRAWKELRQYAGSKGVMIIGDIPMYVSEDSADVWAESHQFTLDEEGHKTMEAGVPPDYFAKEGQLWGNPLFKWDEMKEDGYHWWLRRLERAFYLYDYVRLDHFRGFEAYWAVEAGKKAVDGSWKKGPGAELFQKAFEKFGPLPVLAEDLGDITPGVRGLLIQCGFPGTDVLQFADSDPMEGYLPPEGKVAYSGTHDNQTLVGWCKEKYGSPETENSTAFGNTAETELNARTQRIAETENAEATEKGAESEQPITAENPAETKNADDTVNTAAIERHSEAEIPAEITAMSQKLMENVMNCRADVVILPFQDILGLDDSARMNTPGTTGSNWQWQVKSIDDAGTKEAFARLKEETRKAAR